MTMELNRDPSGAMGDTQRSISANQRIPDPTLNNTSSGLPRNEITLELRPSYPLITTHYGECVYLSEYQKRPPGKADEASPSSYHFTPFQNHCTSSPMLRQDPMPPSPSHNLITKEDYESMVKENVRLKLELEMAKETAEKATKACRDLAAWTIWERNRLLCELEEAKEVHRAFVDNEVNELMADESGYLPFCQ
ncbi:hypothetical protein AA0113_g4678 [Alternaria arborescens]|uniref:Uncharacterized protein n=1 Tax=Alternaria arborescens TaxID=156630 RepID=A0A4Q4SC91_9PLEO|nr:hypothetical protein AA0113_g4678 [Alternaria arborescens]